MNDVHDREPQNPEQADAIARLMRAAGRRAEPSREVYERTFAAATAVLERKLARRQRQRRLLATAAAAVIAVLAVLLPIEWPSQSPQRLIGKTDRIIGTVEARSRGGQWTPLSRETIELRGPLEVRTGPNSGFGVLLANGTSLRVADATTLKLQSDVSLYVRTGKVYLDTGLRRGTPDTAAISVSTPAGTATDIGTQFEVRYREAALRLRVREGRVQLQRQDAMTETESGQQLTVDASGVVQRTDLDADNAEWDWIQVLAPAPDIEGRPLSELLAWVARETGRTIRFETPDLEERAAKTILHGSVRRLAPLEALSVVLATTDLEHALVDRDTILIRLRRQ